MAALSTSLSLLYTPCKLPVGVILNTQALNDMSHNKRCLAEDWREVTGSKLRPQKCILTAVYASNRVPYQLCTLATRYPNGCVR